MRPCIALLLPAWALLATAARADGVLPAQPYRYLHPPGVTSGVNQPPLSGLYVLPVDYMRAAHWFTFTEDGQAGVSGPGGAFTVPRGVTAILIRIDPGETPAGLPSGESADGNAYRVTAAAQPGKRTAVLRKPINVILRWPFIPHAVYRYGAGRWQRLCGAGGVTLTSATISCPATVLGIFLATRRPSATGPHLPATPLSSTRLAWLTRYLPIIGALFAVLLAIVAVYRVARADKGGG